MQAGVHAEVEPLDDVAIIAAHTKNQTGPIVLLGLATSVALCCIRLVVSWFVGVGVVFGRLVRDVVDDEILGM